MGQGGVRCRAIRIGTRFHPPPVLAALASITDPYLNLFRGLIPPIVGIDISVILAFLSLNLTSVLLRGLAVPLLANVSAARYIPG